ncbi:hypothetical protein CIPAW_11G067900 [Carya illinoinensis]|uniref:Uncharacterized protein n=1 Tax=Carya illinoinensis TaxID=32201 RepID=A0A8T1P223_CARIL|nr:hypothetical protein CIPAW_11G067900 [Carya illinoinensis]KAG6687345.1 hypothetical protein I3842_11G065800 [Carya illinoinensis]
MSDSLRKKERKGKTFQCLQEEVHLRRLSLCRLSRQANARTAPNSGILSVSWSHHHHLVRPSRYVSEIASYPWNVGYCTHMLMASYWVGHDPNDGWGFVEASVNQTF